MAGLWVLAFLLYSLGYVGTAVLVAVGAALLTVPLVAPFLADAFRGGAALPPYVCSARGFTVARAGRKRYAYTVFLRAQPAASAEELDYQDSTGLASRYVNSAIDRETVYGFVVSRDSVWLAVTGEKAEDVVKEAKNLMGLLRRSYCYARNEAPDFRFEESKTAWPLVVAAFVLSGFLAWLGFKGNAVLFLLGASGLASSVLGLLWGRGGGVRCWAVQLVPKRSSLTERQAHARMVTAMRLLPSLDAMVVVRYTPGGEEKALAEFGRSYRIFAAFGKPEEALRARAEDKFLRRLEEGESSYYALVFVLAPSLREALKAGWALRQLGFRFRVVPPSMAMRALFGLIKPGKLGLSCLHLQDAVAATFDIAPFCPLVARSPEHTKGIYVGRDEVGRKVYIDFEKLPAHHGIIVGPTGSGKSTFLRHYAYEFRDVYGGKVVFIDPAEEHPGARFHARDLDLATPPPGVSRERWVAELGSYGVSLEALRGSVSPLELFKHDVVSVSLKGLTEAEQAARGMALVTWLVRFAECNWGIVHWPRLLVLYDEAHRVAMLRNRVTGERWIGVMLREARKLGVAVFFASQLPMDFEVEEFINAAVKVALPGNDRPYLDFVSKLFGAGEDGRHWLAGAKVGVALLHRKAVPGYRKVVLELRREAL